MSSHNATAPPSPPPPTPHATQQQHTQFSGIDGSIVLPPITGNVGRTGGDRAPTLPPLSRNPSWLPPGSSYRTNGTTMTTANAGSSYPPFIGAGRAADGMDGNSSGGIVHGEMQPPDSVAGHFESGNASESNKMPSPAAWAASTAAGHYRTSADFSHSPSSHVHPSSEQGQGHADQVSGNSGDDANGLNPPPLRRHQACFSCRKRKLKCDATRPVCGTCKKSREAAAQSRLPAPIPAGDCVYSESPARGERGSSVLLGGTGGQFGTPTTAGRKRARASQAGEREAETPDGVEASRPAKTAALSSANKVKVEHLENRIKHLESLLMRSQEEQEKQRQNQDQNQGQASSSSLEQAQEEYAKADERWRTKAKEWKRDFIPRTSTFATSGARISELPSPGEVRAATASAGENANRSPGAISAGTKEAERKTFAYRSRVKVGVPQNQSQGDTPSGLFELDETPAHATSSLTINQPASSSMVAEPDPLLDLLWPGWPPDLPSPDTVLHLAEIFFARHPLKVMIYKPSFMTSLSLPPRHHDRPDVGLIHAILAAAAPLSPYFDESRTTTRAPTPAPDAGYRGGGADPFAEMLLGDLIAEADAFAQQSTAYGATPSTAQQQQGGRGKITFAQFHLARARVKTAKALVTRDRNPLDLIQASIIINDVLFNEDKILECFLLGGLVARILPPCGLLKLRPFRESASTLGCFLPPPRTAPEEHERRMTFWCAYILEAAYVGNGNYYESNINDFGVTTSLPSSVADFQAGREPADNSQTLSSDDLFENGHIDDFNLHVKSMVLLKRVKWLLSRNNSYTDGDESRLGTTAPKPPGFRELDANIAQFLTSSPPLEDPNRTDRMCARLSALVALAKLHEPFVEIKDPNSYSYKRVEYMVQETLKIIDLIDSTSFDPALIVPRSSLVFVTAARLLAAQIECLRALTMQGDAIDFLYDCYDRIIHVLDRMSVKSKISAKVAQQLRMFRSGQWDGEYLATAINMAGIIPESNDAPGGDDVNMFS